MNILFLSSWYPNKTTPTNGDFVQRHAQAVSTKHTVTVLHVAYDSTLTHTRIQINEEISENLYQRIVYFSLPSYFSFLKKIWFIFIYLQQYKIITKKRGTPSIIHANVLFPIGIVAIILQKIYSIPVVVSEHWHGYLSESGHVIAPFQLRIIRYLAKHVQAMMPVTQHMQKSLQKLHIGHTYYVVPNVVDTQIFSPQPSKRNPNQFDFIHISTLKDDTKNVSGILRAAAQLYEIRKNFKLNIISENINKELEEYVNTLQIKHIVTFCGYKNRTELAEMMQESIALILFSNYESLPCVIVEAFASGLPVISTHVGGISEHLNSDKGILIPKGDETALVNAMKTVLENHTTYNAELLAGYAQQEFSYNAIAEKFDAVYTQILKHRC